jgi:hypothetical protein
MTHSPESFVEPADLVQAAKWNLSVLIIATLEGEIFTTRWSVEGLRVFLSLDPRPYILDRIYGLHPQQA